MITWYPCSTPGSTNCIGICCLYLLVYYKMAFLAEGLIYLRLCGAVLKRQFILIQTHFLFFSFLLLAPLPTLSISSSSPLCKFFPACKKMECPFYHPKVRYISYLPSFLERDLKCATLGQEMLLGFNTFCFYFSHFNFCLEAEYAKLVT